MQFELKKAITILERTPFVLKELLKDIAEEWTTPNEGENTWSPFDVVGHLIHGEKTDWIPRAKIILEGDPDTVFTPFDRFAQKKISKGKSLNQLLRKFERLREENISKLEAFNLQEKDLMLEATHPALGKITLQQLLSSWVVHDLGHIAQISRVMAKQYSTEVGPWNEYLGILK